MHWTIHIVGYGTMGAISLTLTLPNHYCDVRDKMIAAPRSHTGAASLP